MVNLNIKTSNFKKNKKIVNKINYKYPSGNIGFGLQEYTDEKSKELVSKKTPDEVIKYIDKGMSL